MTEKFFHNKLIRDKIPEVIEASGGKYETRNLSDEEYKIELRKKLMEEINEAVESSEEDLPKELADILEVVESLAKTQALKLSDIQKIQEEKRKKRGGFNKKLFLVWSSQPSGK